MKKSDLKTGMRVRLRNGKLCLVLKDYDTVHFGHQDVIFLGFNGGFFLCKPFTDDLRHRSLGKNFDVMAIYTVSDDETLIDSNILNKSKVHLIWERNEPKKMTIEEIEKLLGYEIEVVANKVED